MNNQNPAVTKDDIMDLITWRTLKSSKELRLSDDFEYTWIGCSMNRLEWTETRLITEPMKDLRVRSIFVTEGEAAAFFEALEGVTGLTYQFAWLLEHCEGRIRRLLEIRESLPAEHRSEGNRSRH